MKTLSNQALPALSGVADVPAYEREHVTAGVVHIGVGNFHRAHQAVYFDRLMAETGDLTWGICGVGVLAGDRAMKEALEAQDHLYTVIEKHGDGSARAQVVGSIVEYLLVPDSPDAVIERMASEEIRMVTLTITEGAYAPDSDAPGHGGPLADHNTAFTLIRDALRRRRERGIEPFTVASCDNLPGNGQLTRARVVESAAKDDPALAEWIEHKVPFPNSVVDRIAATTTEQDRADLASTHGIRDRWPVPCEPFSQWVLQDSGGRRRPPLESAGVKIVDDPSPYELMKLRLLNGSHQVLAYLGYLAGHRIVDEAVRDPLFRDLLAGYMDEEGTPTLPPLPEIDVEGYKRTLIERFSNPGVRDTLARLCANSSDRVPAFLLPVVRAQLVMGGDIQYSVLAVAGWARYAEGVDESGEPIDVIDTRRELLSSRARRQRTDPTAFLEDRELFNELVDDERFVDQFRTSLAELHERGARAAVESLTRSSHRHASETTHTFRAP